MHFIPSEQEKLLLSVAGMLASYRKERGVRLNYPEAVAYLSCWVIEQARAGNMTVAKLMEKGKEQLTREHVMDEVPVMLENVQIEATFPDGRKLVTIHNPIT
jgi:urease gamma subunit